MKIVNVLQQTLSFVHVYTFIFMCRRATTGIALIDKQSSYAMFDIWNITNIGKLEFRFKTQTRYSLLLYVDDDRTHIEKNFGSYIFLYLVSGTLKITHQINHEKYRKTISIGNYLNDFRWHSLILTKFIDAFQVQVDDDVLTISDFYSININSNLFIGGLSRAKMANSYGRAKRAPRFYGCIEDIKYSSGSMDTKAVETFASGDNVALHCPDACKKSNPCKNNGKCIGIVDTRCDCFGTGFYGDECHERLGTIHLKSKDYIKYEVFNLRLYVRVIFKSLRADGLILYTRRGRYSFLVELVNGFLRIVVQNSKTFEKNIPKMVFDARWHTLVINKGENNFRITVDGETETEFEVKDAPDEDISEESNNAIYFGGVDQPQYIYGVKSKTNFAGCFKELEFNERELINKILAKQTVKRIKKVGVVKFGCPYNESNIATPSSTPTKIPMTRITAKRDTLRETYETKVIKEIHSSDNGLSEMVIVWITAAIVAGTILIIISAACVVHHLKIRNSLLDEVKSNSSDEEDDNHSLKSSEKSTTDAILMSIPNKEESEPKNTSAENQQLVCNESGL